MDNEQIKTIATIIFMLPAILGLICAAVSTISWLTGKLFGFMDNQVIPRFAYCFMPFYLFVMMFTVYIPLSILSLIFNPLKSAVEAVGRMFGHVEMIVTKEWKKANQLPSDKICTHWEDVHGESTKNYFKRLRENKDMMKNAEASIYAFWLINLIYGISFIVLGATMF